jgi:hypothetical protein
MTDNYIPIDVELYEKLVIIGMRQGHEDPTEFINHVLDVEMKLEEWRAKIDWVV